MMGWMDRTHFFNFIFKSGTIAMLLSSGSVITRSEAAGRQFVALDFPLWRASD
jgi:hypothetical protein